MAETVSSRLSRTSARRWDHMVGQRLLSDALAVRAALADACHCCWPIKLTSESGLSPFTRALRHALEPLRTTYAPADTVTVPAVDAVVSGWLRRPGAARPEAPRVRSRPIPSRGRAARPASWPEVG